MAESKMGGSVAEIGKTEQVADNKRRDEDGRIENREDQKYEVRRKKDGYRWRMAVTIRWHRPTIRIGNHSNEPVIHSEEEEKAVAGGWVRPEITLDMGGPGQPDPLL